MTVSVLSAVVPADRASKVRLDRSAAGDGDRQLRCRPAGRLRPAGDGRRRGVVRLARQPAADALPLIGFGAMTVVLGVFVLGLKLVRRHQGARAAGSVVRGHRQVRPENAYRNPKRTAATASALMIGVALVGVHHDPGVDEGLDRRCGRQVLPQ